VTIKRIFLVQGKSLRLPIGKALQLQQSDSWPGNVHEQENITRRLLLAASGLAVSPLVPARNRTRDSRMDI
jgi:DNA-binding NtrC family response regulator